MHKVQHVGNRDAFSAQNLDTFTLLSYFDSGFLLRKMILCNQIDLNLLIMSDSNKPDFNDLTINLKDTQFFIAIAKEKGHSFIMLGTYKETKVQHLLCRVGKVFDLDPYGLGIIDPHTVGVSLIKAVFSETQAKINDEGIKRKSFGHLAISYQAYDINFQHYLNFIQILESLQKPINRFKCYKPINKTANTVLLKYTDNKVLDNKSLNNSLFSSFNHLSINNTCRHTAIKLIEETLEQSIPAVSTNFYDNLSYTSFLDYGVPSLSFAFYVLPPPPNGYISLDKEKNKIVEKLYKRMEKMILLEPNSKDTQKKFICLKNFYNQLVQDEIQEPSIDKLLYTIQSWKKEHYTTLNNLRVRYFWDDFIDRKSATLNTVEEIERDLLHKL